MSGDKIELKLCPFCGQEAREVIFHRKSQISDSVVKSVYVECMSCLAKGPLTCFDDKIFKTKYEEAEKECIEGWNERIL